MQTVRLIIKEVAHRKVNFALSVIVAAAAVAICVALAVTLDASRRETIRIMRDMGFNLRIVPKKTDMNRFYLTGFSRYNMPQNTIDRLLANPQVSYNHLVATLSGSITVGGCEAILMGLSGELCPPGRSKSPMIFSIKPGTVHVGHAVATRLNLKKGDTLKLKGHTFTVARAMPEVGSADDVRIYISLKDAQRVLDLPGRINEIKALECLCRAAGNDPLAEMRRQISAFLPEVKVVLLSNIADARAKQRQMNKKYAAFVMPFVLIVAAAWVAVLAAMNVRDRRSEIGILRALGYGSGTIGGLLLGRAILVGIIAALVGYGAGAWLAAYVGPNIFYLTAKAIRPQPMLLVWALIGAPLFAAVAAFIPAMTAITQDPAVTLNDE